MTRDVSDKRIATEPTAGTLRCHLPMNPSIHQAIPPLPLGSPFTQLGKVEADLTVLGTTAVTALQLLLDPTLTVGRLSEVIEKDLLLECEVVRLANSALYGVKHPISVLSQVPARLGFDKCHQLVEIAGLSMMMRAIPVQDKSLLQSLWFHGFLTATICAELNQLLQFRGNGEEFRCGLIHDVGNILLAAAVPERVSMLAPLDFRESDDFLEREKRIAGADHCEVGAWFAARKGLSDVITSVIRHHHAPQNAGPHRFMVGLVTMSDHMANHLNLHDTAAGYEPDSNPALSLMFRNDAHRRCLFLTSASALMHKSLRLARLVATI